MYRKKITISKKVRLEIKKYDTHTHIQKKKKIKKERNFKRLCKPKEV